jgi:hypothetical protein
MRITPKQQKLPKWPRPSWLMLQNCGEKAAENMAAKVSEEGRVANIPNRRNKIHNTNLLITPILLIQSKELCPTVRTIRIVACSALLLSRVL